MARCRMNAQCVPPDRISNLPLSIIQTILTLMPIRDAFRTSILSRNWRYNCINIPILVFDDNLLQGVDNSEVSNKCTIFHAVYNILLLYNDPILEFSLCFSQLQSCYEIDRIILYLSRNTNVEKFTLSLGLQAWSGYKLPSSFFSLQKLTHLKLENCKIQPLTTISGFITLTSLWFDDVRIPMSMLLRFLSSCPLLKSFTIFNCYGNGHSNFDELFRCLPLIEHLHMDYDFLESLPLDVSLPRRLPNMLVHLRVLKLDGLSFVNDDDLRSILFLVTVSPKVEKINLEMFYDPDVEISETDMNLLDLQDYSYVILDQLCELEITNFANLKLGMDFVKFILAKSSLLKTVRIVINEQISVVDEVKMLRDLIWNPRASPGAHIKFERP